MTDCAVASVMLQPATFSLGDGALRILRMLSHSQILCLKSLLIGFTSAAGAGGPASSIAARTGVGAGARVEKVAGALTATDAKSPAFAPPLPRTLRFGA